MTDEMYLGRVAQVTAIRSIPSKPASSSTCAIRGSVRYHDALNKFRESMTLDFDGSIPFTVSNFNSLNLDDPSNPLLGFDVDSSLISGDISVFVGDGGWEATGTFSFNFDVFGALQLLQQQNYFNNIQNLFGSQTSAQRMQAIANALPAVCGGGVFVYGGPAKEIGENEFGFQGFYEWDSRSGSSVGAVGEYSFGEFGGGVIRANGSNTPFIFGGSPEIEMGGCRSIRTKALSSNTCPIQCFEAPRWRVAQVTVI